MDAESKAKQQLIVHCNFHLDLPSGPSVTRTLEGKKRTLSTMLNCRCGPYIVCITLWPLVKLRLRSPC